jgi:hypothetical protein
MARKEETVGIGSAGWRMRMGSASGYENLGLYAMQNPGVKGKRIKEVISPAG